MITQIITSLCQELWKIIEILSYFQVIKSAWLSFMDAGRIHEIPWTETRDFYSQHNKEYRHHHTTVNFPWPKSHGWVEFWVGPEGCLQTQWLVLYKRTPSLGNPNLYKWTTSLPDLSPRGRPYLYDTNSKLACPLLQKKLYLDLPML